MLLVSIDEEVVDFLFYCGLDITLSYFLGIFTSSTSTPS